MDGRNNLKMTWFAILKLFMVLVIRVSQVYGKMN